MGFLACVLAALLSSSKDLFSKKISFQVSGIHSAFASFIYALPFYAFVLIVASLAGFETFAVTPAFWWLVVARSLTDSLAEWAKMQSMVHADISQIICFLSLAPLFLLFVSPIITGDIPGPLGCLGVVLIVAGSLLAVDGLKRIASANRSAIGLALLSSFFFSLNASFDRLAVKEASPLLSGAAMTFFAAIILFIPAMRRGHIGASFRGHHRDFLSRGALELCFMVSKLTALQFIQAPYVVALMKMSLLFSIIGGRLFFNEPHFKKRLLAGAIVSVSIVLIILEEYVL